MYSNLKGTSAAISKLNICCSLPIVKSEDQQKRLEEFTDELWAATAKARNTPPNATVEHVCTSALHFVIRIYKSNDLV
jgi:hypothetical protein